MPLIQPPVTDEGSWGYRGSINYSPDGTARTGMKVFPPSLTSPLLRVRTVAGEVPGKWKKPPDHWYLAGNLNLVHGTFRDARVYKVPLNYDSIFWVEPIAYPYQVGFDAVDWLPVLDVKIYEWTGELLTQTQPPDLSAIEDELAALGLGIEAIARNQALQNQAITQGNLLPGILAPLQADLAASTTSLQLLGTGIL